MRTLLIVEMRTILSSIVSRNMWILNAKSRRCFSSAGIDSVQDKNHDIVRIDESTVKLLQQLSLVNFGNVAAIHRLEAAVSFADQLMEVDTTGIEPLYTVQDRGLYLRDDIRTEGNCRNELLKLAAKTQEEYYTSPSGNIPITFQDEEYNINK